MQTLLVLAVLIVGCTASGNQFFHFELGQQLVCMNRNPHAAPGEPPFVPEDTPLVSFVPGEPGSVYLPMTSGYKSPLRGPLPRRIAEELREFLQPDLRVTSIGEEYPRGLPIIPGTILPANVPVSSGDFRGGVGTTVAPNKDYGALTLEVLMNNEKINPLDYDTVVNAVTRLTDRCQVNATWTKLPDGQFFPQWVSAAFCSAENCSFIEGLRCNPVLREDTLILVLVLRWDCCWSVSNYIWRWECGWRKVWIPLIGQCACSCFDVFDGIFPLHIGPYSHTGRIGATHMSHINGLNTK